MTSLSAIPRLWTPFINKASFLCVRHVTTLSFGLLGTGCAVKSLLLTRDWVSLNGAIKDKRGEEKLVKLMAPLSGLSEASSEIIELLPDDHRLTNPTKELLKSIIKERESGKFNELRIIEAHKSLKGIIAIARNNGAYAAAYAVLGLGFLTCAAFSYRYIARLPLPKLAVV